MSWKVHYCMFNHFEDRKKQFVLYTKCINILRISLISLKRFFFFFFGIYIIWKRWTNRYLLKWCDSIFAPFNIPRLKTSCSRLFQTSILVYTLAEYYLHELFESSQNVHVICDFTGNGIQNSSKLQKKKITTLENLWQMINLQILICLFVSMMPPGLSS